MLSLVVSCSLWTVSPGSIWTCVCNARMPETSSGAYVRVYLVSVHAWGVVGSVGSIHFGPHGPARNPNIVYNILGGKGLSQSVS